MLHAVAVDVGQEVHQEGEVAVVPLGERAEDALFLGGHGLAHAGECGGLFVGALMVQRQAKLGVADLPVEQGVAADLQRGVHHAVHIGRGPEAVVVRGELGGHLPAAALGHGDFQGDGILLEAVRPHERSRRVDVRMGGIDARVGAVGAVAE